MAAAWGHGGRGIGAGLIERGLISAERLGHRAVLLVGDESYYRRFGFHADLTRHMELPGPVDRRRFLARNLEPGTLEGASGLVRPAGLFDPARGLRAA